MRGSMAAPCVWTPCREAEVTSTRCTKQAAHPKPAHVLQHHFGVAACANYEVPCMHRLVIEDVASANVVIQELHNVTWLMHHDTLHCEDAGHSIQVWSSQMK